MADDARINTALPNHPKTIKLQRRLKEPGCWSLVCLFLWVAANRSDGNLCGMTDEDIEIAAKWSGDANIFVKCLVEVRFLDGEPGLYTIHDWYEHNPWAATREVRVAAARNAAKKKWEGVRKALAAEADAERMRSAEKGNAHLTTPPNHNTKRSKPSASIEAVDHRHSPIRDFIKQCITYATKLDPAPWNGRDAKSLQRVLESNPSWDTETFKKLIQNRFRSDVPRGDPAYKWLPEISKYANGPLDRFDKPIQENGNGKDRSSGTPVSRQQERNDLNRDAIIAGIFGPRLGGDAPHGCGSSENHGDSGGVLNVGQAGKKLLT